MALWTIHALSEELGISRKNLARRLDGLRPAETMERRDGRTEKRYKLSDVLERLHRPAAENGYSEQRFIEALAQTVQGALLAVCSATWLEAVASRLIEEDRLTQAQARAALETIIGTLIRDLPRHLAAPDSEILLPREDQ